MNKVDVLDKGHVILVDMMGSDLSVVNSARISFGKTKESIDDRDIKLINYLMKNKHWTPFEHVIFTFSLKCPLFVARQIMRHRTFSFNERSRRYTSSEIEFYVPEFFRRQSTDNKQGSTDEKIWFHDEIKVDKFLNSLYLNLYAEYKLLLDEGVAREQARMILPTALYTEFYMTGNLRNWFHFITLRAHHHAQKETQEYAYAIKALIKKTVPYSFDAWEKYGQAM